MRVPRIRTSLSLRFALAFAAVAALTMALAAAILGYVWAGQFDAYVRENLQRTADGAASMLQNGYQHAGGWSLQTFAQLPRFGVLSGLGLQVINEAGVVIYDDSQVSSRMTETALGPPLGVEHPDGPTASAPVVVSGDIVGFVRVWPLTSDSFLSESDQRFRRSSFSGLAAAAFIAVAAASLAGLAYSMTFARPLDKITETAERLRAGERDARTGLGGSDSLGVLGHTFDEMADSIEADRELERRLTADVAHELRTPLQAIQATVEAMQDGVYPADAEHLEIVRDETIRLSRLADGILELTRLERGSVSMHMCGMDPSVPVRAAIDAHRALLDAAGLTLVEELVPGMEICGDPDRLTQAVGNLLSNAARYTPSGGRVCVALKGDGARAIIEVADSGIGIAEEDLERVFSRFWRADGARDRASGGLGIGLSVVREIVERHHGTVSAKRLEGGGALFTIALPLDRGQRDGGQQPRSDRGTTRRG